jgi:hypothetical protein
MFRKSENSQGDLFSNILSQVGSRKQKMLEDGTSWHNVFHREVLNRIDETPYSVLYHSNNGRPNASVRVLISMMILKEGHGWSDEQLFDRCRFDLKLILALGGTRLQDSIPTESTYYEFRRLLVEHNEDQQEDLLKTTFTTITTAQVKDLKISGKKIRMDSKLINSNIATSTRLNMILESVRKFVASHHINTESKTLSPRLVSLLEALQTKTASNISYSLNGKEKKETLIDLGVLIKFLLEGNGDGQSKEHLLLARIYREQYEEVKDSNDDDDEAQQQVQLKKPKDIPSSSIQSVHDPDAAYRTKGQGHSKQTVAGYHANIVESCDQSDMVNLILDVEVVRANVCEDAFLEAAIDNSESILQTAHGTNLPKIQEVITDGGYDSLENRTEMLKDNRCQWSLAKTKGGKRVFDISKINDKDNEYEVVSILSGQECSISFSQKAQKYVIDNPGDSKRYMTLEQIENYIKRQEIESQSNKESYNLRANVESTIHQTFHRLKNRGKIVYRRQLKCQWYVISRSLWVNMTRIKTIESLNNLYLSLLVICAPIKSLSAKNEYHPNIPILNFAIL